jgi:hypothetical protein
MKHVEEIIKTCESKIKSIKDSYDKIQQEIRKFPDSSIYKGNWDYIPLKARYIKNNQTKTSIHSDTFLSGLLDDKLIVTASFSILRPGANITPHTGYKGFADKILRAHICIETSDNCALLVDGKEYKYKVGKGFWFDDTFEHSAYNNGTNSRVVLLLDISRDPNNIPALVEDMVKEFEEVL